MIRSLRLVLARYRLRLARDHYIRFRLVCDYFPSARDTYYLRYLHRCVLIAEHRASKLSKDFSDGQY